MLQQLYSLESIHTNKEHVYTKSCTWMETVVLFITAETKMQLR